MTNPLRVRWTRGREKVRASPPSISATLGGELSVLDTPRSSIPLCVTPYVTPHTTSLAAALVASLIVSLMMASLIGCVVALAVSLVMASLIE